MDRLILATPQWEASSLHHIAELYESSMACTVLNKRHAGPYGSRSEFLRRTE